MNPRGCVLYLIPSDMLWLDGKLAVAQQHALKLQLPLAVVSSIKPEEYHMKLTQLLIIEKQLDKHDIAFIPLIGTEAATLPSLVKHTHPVHVHGHGGDRAGNRLHLVQHPYKWPGVVVKTKDLKKLVDRNEYMC